NLPQIKLVVGLVDVQGNYAAALAYPAGRNVLYVYLQQRADGWHVIESTNAPAAENLRRRGIPESLWFTSEATAVVKQTVSHVQDVQPGRSAYTTRPRIVGDYARLWIVPGETENLDSITMFLKRENGVWSYLSAGSAFPEDHLRELGVPEELWRYGEGVRGPTS
ncbi:MAG: hypothetical protein JOZ51_16505, partial [Chloroflexi bacterium]|nr:hypothetical protein [Chloroflexota bacterium]